MSAPRPLLVIAHEATRTGSPAVLLRLLRATAHEMDRPLSVRLLADGPLAGELRSLSTVDPVVADPAAVLVNSALAVGELATLAHDLPCAVYVHEQSEALAGLPDSEAELLRTRPRVVLAASTASAAALLGLGVREDRIEVLAPLVEPPRADPEAVAAIRSEVGGGTGRLVVGCGVAEWRKGADLFVELAARLAGDDGPLLAWVGGRGRAMSRRLDADVFGAGLAGRVLYTGEVADPAPWLAAADVVVMPSREDPQPLVPVEAALLGTPSAGFEVGGLADMAAAGALRGAPYPDVVALGTAVTELLEDRTLAEQVTAAGADWWAGRHAAAAVLPHFRAVLQDLLP
ncbi:MAG: glycosyltransferase family 4 protein [Microthrixaceae bacterium]